ncbi:hypothetical protein Pmani_006121 [Petrolisthes manimaculis]|uniref:Auto-transporter adhesin head GIN domain-containing protein n=1 Tax=Petrolisthes manimaculis TaxID=1843537 RepID=A0AAE1QCG8_9EUCA|nr:hypothetical protein Pmani_006121 [Petrolisthes manimaculis]
MKRACVLMWKAAVMVAWTGLLLWSPAADAALPDRPRVRSEGGHLRLEGGANRNISLSTSGSGAVNINGVDVAGSLSLRD